MKDTEAVRAVMNEAVERMEAGRRKYGPFDPRQDTRDLTDEVIQELLDAICYMAMEILKLRHRRDKADRRLIADILGRDGK